MTDQETKPPAQVIRPVGIPSGVRFGSHTVWGHVNVAQDWFEDAWAAARAPGLRARRHEVVFAVCFAESWLYEWVRDVVLPRRLHGQFDTGDGFELVNKTFRPEDRNMGIRERWTAVYGRLKADGLVQRPLNYKKAQQSAWNKLAELRNGLVHGETSRPYIQGEPGQPKVTHDDLARTAPGWAIETATQHAMRLRDVLPRSAQQQWPAWLVPVSKSTEG